MVNPVQQRIGELACLEELGPRTSVVRSVSRKEVIPDRRYSWRLYADENGTELVDVVVLDVNLDVALDIDVEVQGQLEPPVHSQPLVRVAVDRRVPFAFRAASVA